jgi:phage terminase large subunit-like protein
MIPEHLIVPGSLIAAKGEGGALDTVQVQHVSGGISTLRFRTYQAGRVALQGESLDFVWLDEEPADFEVYTECLARITATNGCLIITFTPLLGMSSVSIRYRQEFSPDRTFVQMGIADIPPAKGDAPAEPDRGGGIPVYGHISVVDREKIVEGYPEHEREARSKGEPMLGEGRVYKTAEPEILAEIDPHTAPGYWRWGGGMDIGISHP